MFYGLTPGLSQRVLGALRLRLARAMSDGTSAALVGADALPPPAPEAPETPVGEVKPADEESVRDRSRNPRQEVPEEVEKKLRKEFLRELTKEFLEMVPNVDTEPASQEKLLQAQMSLGIGVVSLIGVTKDLAETVSLNQEGLNEMSRGLNNNLTHLATCLTNIGTGLESLAAGVNHHPSQIGGPQGRGQTDQRTYQMVTEVSAAPVHRGGDQIC